MVSNPAAVTSSTPPSLALSYSKAEGDEEVLPSRQRRGVSREEGNGTDAPGVISLIFGCLAVLCLLFGFLTCGVSFLAAVPFALIGGLVGFFGKGNLRVAGLLLNFLALIPAVITSVGAYKAKVKLEEVQTHFNEGLRQRKAELRAAARREEAEARKRKAEAKQLRLEAVLKAQEARLLEQRRQKEHEEALQKAEEEREEKESRALLEKQRKAEQEVAKEMARKTDLENKGLPYYPYAATVSQGHNAKEWHQLLLDKPNDIRLWSQAGEALISLKEEGIPFLLDVLSRQTTLKGRDESLRLIRVEYIHANDLRQLLPCLDRSKNYPATQLRALEYLEKRAKDIKKEFVPEIENLVDGMLNDSRFRERTKEEIRGRLQTIRTQAKR